MTIPSPVPNGTFSDSFGDPRSGGRRHAGVDILAPLGSKVYAPIGGTVRVAGPDGGNGGNRVWVVGDDGLAYYFAHLASITARVGDRVQSGTQLGTVGQTGNAANSVPHLHFSINSAVGPEHPVVNPFSVIDRSLRLGASNLSVGFVGPVPDRPATVSDDTGNSSTTAAGDGGLWGDGCAWGGSVDVPGPFNFKGCIISRGQARALVGGLTITAGGLVIIAGTFLIVRQSFDPMARLGSVLARSNARSFERERAATRSDELEARRASASARMTSAQDRQEASESRIARRHGGDSRTLDQLAYEPF